MLYGEFIELFGAGAIGSLVRILVDKGTLSLPCRVSGGLALGFVGSVIVGGFVGCVVDGGVVTAAMGGYVGASVLEHLLPESSVKEINEKGC